MSERDAGFLARWSRLKHRNREPGAADSGDVSGAAVAAGVPSVVGLAPGDAGGRTELPPASGASPASVSTAASHPAADPATAEPALPPLESLTPESDFRPFMRAGTDSATRNAALKRLFADPQFNVMDGLDVYIDDYGKTEPIPPPLLARLMETHAPSLSESLSESLSDRDADMVADATPDATPDAQRVASADAAAGSGAGGDAAGIPEAQASEAPPAKDPAVHVPAPGGDTDPCSKLHRY
ncbi:MAG: DUF3306 domain-containing protein [Burkholderiaceae bacterium]|nr:DUF3306 domain-containing protein [Burkholderiaceae bacterium]